MGQSTKVEGLVLTYGYVEEQLSGFDVWAHKGKPFPGTWEALRSLAAYLFEFFKEEHAYERSCRNTCCAAYQGKNLEDVLRPELVPGKPGDKPGAWPVKACPVCGNGIRLEHYHPQEFSQWILGSFTSPYHAQPHWYENKDWQRDVYDRMMRKKHKWPLIEEAELVLVAALPVELLPPLCRGAFHDWAVDTRMSDELEKAQKRWEKG